MLIAWAIIVIIAKGLKLENHGFSLTAYSLTYRNQQVQDVLTKILGRTKRGIRVFADVSVVAGFIMMGFAFWFLITNIIKFFEVKSEFNQLTLLSSRTYVNIS